MHRFVFNGHSIWNKQSLIDRYCALDTDQPEQKIFQWKISESSNSVSFVPGLWWRYCARAQVGALSLQSSLQNHAEEKLSSSTHDLPPRVSVNHDNYLSLSKLFHVIESGFLTWWLSWTSCIMERSMWTRRTSPTSWLPPRSSASRACPRPAAAGQSPRLRSSWVIIITRIMCQRWNNPREAATASPARVNLQQRNLETLPRVGNHEHSCKSLRSPKYTFVNISGNSPSSTPVSAKSPVGVDDDESDPPQLSVKREFSINSAKRAANDDLNDDEEDSQPNNLLDCLVQAQNYALQQAAGNKNFENNITNFSAQHIMQQQG